MDKIEEIEEPKSFLDGMKPNKFYSVGEIGEMVLGYKMPFTAEDAKAYLKSKGGSPSEMMIEIAALFSNLSYVMTLISYQVMIGDLVRGRKGGQSYFSRISKK